jgi:hypothetical protein
MKFTTALASLLLAAVAVDASNVHDFHRRHDGRMARRASDKSTKTCQRRHQTSVSPSPTSSHAAATAPASPSPPPNKTQPAQDAAKMDKGSQGSCSNKASGRSSLLPFVWDHGFK